MQKKLDIEFLFFEDCPSHDQALARLGEILNQEGIEAKVEVIKMETEKQARRLRFVGSPTIRIGGEDIDPVSPEATYALACRAYRNPNGRITPLPPKEMIRSALRAAASE